MLGWMKTARLPALLLALFAIAGCSANPVTGEKELVLFSTGYEIETGANHSLPLQRGRSASRQS